VWNQHLHKKLVKMGWTQGCMDECLYSKGNIFFVVYVDDGIFMSPFRSSIDKELKEMQKVFNISINGDLNDYVGVNIKRTNDGMLRMTQPQLTNSVLKEVNFNRNTKSSTTPAYSTTVLKEGKGKAKHCANWSNHQIIGKLNFITASCRPKLSCGVHQCARFSKDPRVNHTEAVKRTARYLTETAHQGIEFKPTDHSFQVGLTQIMGAYTIRRQLLTY
jgi:Reverse transcriptase (RNA-dependent DNA polymerase)